MVITKSEVDKNLLSIRINTIGQITPLVDEQLKKHGYYSISLQKLFQEHKMLNYNEQELLIKELTNLYKDAGWDVVRDTYSDNRESWDNLNIR